MNSRGTLGDSPQGLTKVLTSTNEWDLELVFTNVVLVIGHGQDLGFLFFSPRSYISPNKLTSM
jgi:hypothetical protein